MGGDHHHHQKIVVPDYRIYKIDERSPQLLRVQRELAQKGLKDPWLRNEVWRYMGNDYGTAVTRAWKLFRRGLMFGVAAFAITTGLETLADLAKPPNEHHDHH